MTTERLTMARALARHFAALRIEIADRLQLASGGARFDNMLEGRAFARDLHPRIAFALHAGSWGAHGLHTANLTEFRSPLVGARAANIAARKDQQRP